MSSGGSHPGVGPPVSAETLLLVAFLLFAISVRVITTEVNGLVVLLAVAVLGWSMTLRHKRTPLLEDLARERGWEIRLLMGVVFLGSVGAAGWSPSAIGPSSTALERLPGLVWVLFGLATYILGRRKTRLVLSILAVSAVAFTIAVGLVHIAEADGIGFDVLFLHQQAADALADGQNPYTDAVEVPNGAPTAQPGDLISGYVYPPVTALAYAAGEWAFADPRYTSLTAWLIVLTAIGVLSVIKRRTDTLLIMLLLAAIPGWPLVLRAAWTEPLSLAFLTLAFVLWRLKAASGAGLGLALASKQYFVVSAPLFLLNRDEGWQKRLILTSTVVISTLGAAVVWGPTAFWSSAVEFHMTTPPRPDSMNLVGLFSSPGSVWDPPPLLAIGIGLAAATLVGRIYHDRVWAFLTLGFSLAASFLVTTQAFANYWFLIAGICILALLGSTLESENSRRKD